MSHDCRNWLCDTPHECRDCCSSAEDCSHEHCHEHMGHLWREWNIYPRCTYCEDEMLAYWAEELEAAHATDRHIRAA